MGRQLHGLVYVKHVNSAAIGGSGKLSARGIKGERSNHDSCRYAVAHVPPCQTAIGAGENARIRGGEDMFRICRIDRHISIDEVRVLPLGPRLFPCRWSYRYLNCRRDTPFADRWDERSRHECRAGCPFALPGST